MEHVKSLLVIIHYCLKIQPGKRKIYEKKTNSCILIALLYSLVTLTIYLGHLKLLDSFHLRVFNLCGRVAEILNLLQICNKLERCYKK